jgi:predicted ATPase
MAPEQAEGVAVGPEADWYSFGVMLFLALTGTLPFEGSPGDVVAAKLTSDAPAPHERAAGLPADLDELCSALLQREPADRPRGEEIAARLGVAVGDSYPSGIGTTDASSPFVGRATELRALGKAFEDVVAGEPRVVVVEGEPGIGKSALVHRFLGTLGSGALVLSGRCYEQETVPFKGVDGIVDAISEHLFNLPVADAPGLLEGGVRYLAAIFPVLRRVPAVARVDASQGEVADPAALREQGFGELERLVAALARQKTVVLFVDDLQWADPDSLELLQRVLLGPSAAPCFFLGTMRSGSELAWSATDAPARFTSRATRVALTGLSSKESMALLDVLTSSRSLSGRKESLVEEAQGHPLFLTELMRGARSGAEATRDGAGRADLEDVLWSRIAGRDDVDRRVMELVAVAGAPIPYDVIAHAAGVDVGECQTRLGTLRAAQLLRVGRRGRDRLIEPYHDRIREAVLRRLRDGNGMTTALAEKHRRLGEALLERTPADALGARVFPIVHHLNAASALLTEPADRRRLAELNLVASRQARLATAHARASEYARAGIALLGDQPWTEAYELARDLTTARMAADLFAGDAAAAKESFEVARAKVTSVPDKTSLYVAWIALQTSRGELAAAVETGREGLRELGSPIPAKVSKVSVLSQYVACRYHQGRRPTSDLLHLPRLADPVREGVIELVVALAPAAFFLDTNLLAWLELEGVAVSVRYGVSEVSSYAFAVYGTVLTAVFGKHDEGDAFGRLALALNERFQNHKLAARLHFLYGGWHACWVRPIREGLGFMQTGHELATKYGDTAYETYTASTRALLEFSESRDLPSVQAVGEWAKEIGLRRQDLDMAGFAEVFARSAMALRGLTPGPCDLSLPSSSDDEFRATLTDTKTPCSVYYYLYCRAELAYLAGDAATALPLLDEAWKRVQIVFGLPTAVDLCFLDALVCARLHDTATATARFGLRRRVAKRVASLRGWAQSCAANYEPYHLVALAELARIRGDALPAEACFERALTASRAHKSLKREALALDLAAAFFRGRGDPRADERAREASDAYRRWGRAAKVVR